MEEEKQNAERKKQNAVKGKSHRGGARKGAGRPRVDSKLFAFRAPGVVARYIEKQESKTDVILKALSMLMASDGEKEGPIVLTGVGEATSAEKVKPLNLPYFDMEVRAGSPVMMNNDERAEDVELLQMLCPHPEASYLIRVAGESMINAGIAPGDILIVDRSNRTPSEHEPALCELNGEYTLKFVVSRYGRYWLVPANPIFSKIEVRPEDEFYVWGTVTYVIHKARRRGNSEE